MHLRLEAVGFVFPSGVRALDGVDLDVPAGTSLAIMGATGSGKTTLLRHLDGLLRPSSGRILLDGTDIAGRSVARLAADVGITFQHPDRQILARTVAAEVAIGPRNLGRPSDRVRAAVASALEAVGLADAAAEHPSELGRGRRRLLTIASVLAMETSIVGLDEPLVGLDGRGRERVADVVRRLREAGRTSILVGHDVDFAAEHADRIVVLHDGRITLDASPADAFGPHHHERLGAAGLGPPAAARHGIRLGVGPTPTIEALVEALRARTAAPRSSEPGDEPT